MATFTQPHVHEASSRRALLAAARLLGSLALMLAIAGVALGARWFLAAGVPLAPRVMVPL